MSGILSNEDVSLANLAGGAAIERFDLELEKVLKNIMDPNTTAKQKRKIKLTITIVPSEDRDYAHTEIACESTLAPLTSFTIPLHIGIGPDGKPIARQSSMQQKTFADIPKDEPDSNVTTFERKQNPRSKKLLKKSLR